MADYATDLNAHDVAAFVSKNYAYYDAVWIKHQKPLFANWNWASFFFNAYWLGYRKMHREALLSIALPSAFAVLALFLPLPLINHQAVRAVIVFSLGFYGDALYRKKFIRVAQAAQVIPDAERKAFLAKRGGTSVSGVVVCVALDIIGMVIPMVLANWMAYIS